MDSEKGETVQSRPSPPASAMFEGRNIHQSPVDGKLLCSYSEKVCMQRRLNGYAFCIRHILEDKCAPFKQCQFFAKYNGSRCINPVPVAENRTYCNSHLQVLGLVPKKVRKKKNVTIVKAEQSDTDEHATNSTTKNTNKKRKKNAKSSCTDSKEKQIEEKTGKKGARRKATRDQTAKTKTTKLSGSVNQSCRSSKNPKANERYHPDVARFKAQRHSVEETEGHRLESYMFDYDSNDSEPTDCLRVPMLSTFMNTDSDVDSGSSTNTGLKYQLWQLRKQLRANGKDKKWSYSAFQSLVRAARSNSRQLAQVLDKGSTPKQETSGMKRAGRYLCGFSLDDQPCESTALPFSRFCKIHVCNDDRQVLFGTCEATQSDGSACRQIVFRFGREKQLCDAHCSRSLIQAGQNNDEKLPHALSDVLTEKMDKVVKQLNGERCNAKQAKLSTPNKRSLKAHMQKMFSIVPTFSSSKMNRHLKERSDLLHVSMPVADNCSSSATPVNQCKKSSGRVSRKQSTDMDADSHGSSSIKRETLIEGDRVLVNGDHRSFDNELSPTPDSERVVCMPSPQNQPSFLRLGSFSASSHPSGTVPHLSWSSGAPHRRNSINVEQNGGGKPMHATDVGMLQRSLAFGAHGGLHQDAQLAQGGRSAMLRPMTLHGFTSLPQTMPEIYPNKQVFQMSTDAAAKSQFAVTSQSPLKSFVRLTGPVPQHSTALNSSSIISPPFQIAAPAHSQIFRFDPTTANTFLPSQQHVNIGGGMTQRKLSNKTESPSATQIRPKLNPDMFLSSSLLLPRTQSNSLAK